MSVLEMRHVSRTYGQVTDRTAPPKGPEFLLERKESR
jgi:hypothetical protein